MCNNFKCECNASRLNQLRIMITHQFFTSSNVPPPVASSAYHTCLVPDDCRLRIRGRMPMAYMHIVRGSPCVVPSCEDSTSSPMNRSAAPPYVFARMVAREGQRTLMLCRAACWLRRLNALLASTSSTASVLSSSYS